MAQQCAANIGLLLCTANEPHRLLELVVLGAEGVGGQKNRALACIVQHAAPAGKAAAIKQGQQSVVVIGVHLLDFIDQNGGPGMFLQAAGQNAVALTAHIAIRGADELVQAGRFGVFTAVDADQVAAGAARRHRLGQQSLAHSGRTGQ